MAYTTFTDYESVEKPVVLEGHKWRLEDTEWVSEEVEKEGIECDCCTHRIGTFDDDDFEPYATLGVNPQRYMVDLYSNEPFQPGHVQRRIRHRLVNQINSKGSRISKLSAKHGGTTAEHAGYRIKASAENVNYHGSDTDLHIISNGTLSHAIQDALISAIPNGLYPSDDIHVDGELHFCEGCAEEFGVPPTHGHSPLEELSEDEDEEEESKGVDANEAADRAAFAELWSALLSEGLPGALMLVAPTLVTEWLFGMDSVEFLSMAVLNTPAAMSMMGLEAVTPLAIAIFLTVASMIIGGLKLLIFYGLTISVFISVFVRMATANMDSVTRPPN